MVMDLFDIATAQGRLNSSVIRYDKTPFYIETVGEENRRRNFYLFGRLLDGGEGRELKVSLSDNHLNFAPLPLGFINRPRSCVRVSRLPLRMWKVGLHNDNMMYCHITDKEFMHDGFDFYNFVSSDGFRDAMADKFPSYQEIVGKKSENLVKAFSRDWAIHRVAGQVTHLINKYQGRVGTIEGKDPVLLDKFRFLQESLYEDMNNEIA